uniref:Uncharacterized protein n=1 Tax=Anopheles braziliensis TaxID=58242 RepID=A0A2M3ZL69_9DIPT
MYARVYVCVCVCVCVCAHAGACALSVSWLLFRRDAAGGPNCKYEMFTVVAAPFLTPPFIIVYQFLQTLLSSVFMLPTF